LLLPLQAIIASVRSQYPVTGASSSRLTLGYHTDIGTPRIYVRLDVGKLGRNIALAAEAAQWRHDPPGEHCLPFTVNFQWRYRLTLKRRRAAG
jgi:hypothetical protein